MWLFFSYEPQRVKDRDRQRETERVHVLKKERESESIKPNYVQMYIMMAPDDTFA